MSSKHCQVEHCPHWIFAGGLCRKHAALKLLSSPASPSAGSKPTPMQLYRKMVDLPSASRAHYDAVLHNIDRALSAQICPGAPNDEPVAAAASRVVDAAADAAAGHQQLSPPLSRSAAARWAASHLARPLQPKNPSSNACPPVARRPSSPTLFPSPSLCFVLTACF